MSIVYNPISIATSHVYSLQSHVYSLQCLGVTGLYLTLNNRFLPKCIFCIVLVKVGGILTPARAIPEMICVASDSIRCRNHFYQVSPSDLNSRKLRGRQSNEIRQEAANNGGMTYDQ